MIILDPLIRIIITALDIYVFFLIASVIMTWLVHFNVINTSNQFVSMVGRFLWQITEPPLRFIRRFIPGLRRRGCFPHYPHSGDLVPPDGPGQRSERTQVCLSLVL